MRVNQPFIGRLTTGVKANKGGLVASINTSEGKAISEVSVTSVFTLAAVLGSVICEMTRTVNLPPRDQIHDPECELVPVMLAHVKPPFHKCPAQSFLTWIKPASLTADALIVALIRDQAQARPD